MRTNNGKDRRGSAPSQQDLLVDVGVNYLRTVGIAKAAPFLAAHGIPHEVIARVTSAQGPRRPTHWESCIDEEATRRALGARPLLRYGQPDE